MITVFALDLTATQTAQLTGASLRSVNAIFLCLRRETAAECERKSPLEGVLELDESYLGPHRVRGKVGRGCGGVKRIQSCAYLFEGNTINWQPL